MQDYSMISSVSVLGGNPARTSTTMVNIEVLDANDEYPKFSNDQYIGYVKENTPPGQLVAQVLMRFDKFFRVKMSVALLSLAKTLH